MGEDSKTPLGTLSYSAVVNHGLFIFVCFVFREKEIFFIGGGQKSGNGEDFNMPPAAGGKADFRFLPWEGCWLQILKQNRSTLSGGFLGK